jgi:hypothetical protein
VADAQGKWAGSSSTRTGRRNASREQGTVGHWRRREPWSITDVEQFTLELRARDVKVRYEVGTGEVVSDKLLKGGLLLCFALRCVALYCTGSGL